MLSATITINGISKQFATQNYYGYVYVQAAYVQHLAVDYTYDASGYTDNQVYHIASPAGATANLDADVPAELAVTDYGCFQLVKYDSNGVQQYYSYGYLDYTMRNTFSIGDAIPEPASWTLMIAGFGLTGFAARQRRRTVAA